MPAFEMGQFSFVRMTVGGVPGGTPPTVQQVTSITQRPGVDGTGIILHGAKGQPFEMQTLVDEDDHLTAHDVIALYREAVGTIQQLKFNNILYLDYYNTAYAVLNVANTQVRAIGASAGGLSNYAQVVISATWTLLPIQAFWSAEGLVFEEEDEEEE